MNADQVLETYDESYAQRYESVFILNRSFRFLQKTRFELRVLRALTEKAESWLDVACGTGYFLKHGRGHTELRCGGLDLSPAMLALALQANPDAELIQANYRDQQPDWDHRWTITSCLWGAYALQESIADIEKLVDNLAHWTASNGACFLPVFDPAVLVAQRDRDVLPPGMEVERDGTRWSFTEPDGKQHQRVITPPVAVMEEMLAERFSSIRIFPYPGLRLGVPMIGLLATGS